MVEHFVEHIGLVVKDGEKMAQWYAKHLGFIVLKSFPIDVGHVAFIQCPRTKLIFELITNKNEIPIEDAVSHPLQFHIAIKCEKIEEDKNRLIAAGAEFAMDCPVGPDAIVMVLKDPWGNHIQLAQRKEDFYN